MQGYYIPQRSSTHRVYSGARQACRGELLLEQRSSVLPLVESSLSDHLHLPLSVPSVPKRETRHSHVQYLLVQGVVEPDSVPARLGKGQGAKGIGHTFARERPKSGHNLVRERQKIGHTLRASDQNPCTI